MVDRLVARWIGRMLGHPAVLRLLWEHDHGDPSQYTFVYALEHIPEDSEHPDGRRDDTKRQVESWTRTTTHDPWESWTTVMNELSALWTGSSALRQALRSRFPTHLLGAVEIPDAIGVQRIDWIETHAHLRGSVHFPTMFRKWRNDERYTRALRKHVIEWNGWKCSVAELLAWIRALPKRHCRCQWRPPRRAPSNGPNPPLRYCCAVYVALHQYFVAVRDIPGLKSFSTTYDRYGKAQKLTSGALAMEFAALVNGMYKSYENATRSSPHFSPSFGYKRRSARVCWSCSKNRARQAASMPPRDFRPRAQHLRASRRFRRERWREMWASSGNMIAKPIGIEARPTLERLPVDNLRRLRLLILPYLEKLLRSGDGSVPSLGFVLSLFKQEGIKNRSEPTGPEVWDRQVDLWENQVEGVLTLCEEEPVIRRFVLGFDVAGQEMGCPPWVFRSCVQKIREYNRRHRVDRLLPKGGTPAGTLRRILQESGRFDAGKRTSGATHDQWWTALGSSCVPFTKLGVTVHAGEDFIDPMTGLRHIWESVRDLALEPGDRIGHGVAVSLCEDRLTALLNRRAAHRGHKQVLRDSRTNNVWRIRKPRGTHLADLRWEIDLCEPSESSGLQASYADCVGRAFGAAPPPNRFQEITRRSRAGDTVYVPGVRFDDIDQVDVADWEWVTLDLFWMRRFERRRIQVLEELITKQIVIESCPVSNVIVCNLDAPPITELAKYPSLQVTLALDNPGLMHTTVQQDVQLCIDSGLSESMLRRVLNMSCQASFLAG